jgi:hypothetical protein
MNGKINTGHETGWLERRGTRRLLWALLWAACAGTLVAEGVLQWSHLRHGHFGKHSVDAWWGFYAVLGFVGCALMILVAKVLGIWLKRTENYYQEQENQTRPEDNDEYSI